MRPLLDWMAALPTRLQPLLPLPPFSPLAR